MAFPGLKMASNRFGNGFSITSEMVFPGLKTVFGHLLLKKMTLNDFLLKNSCVIQKKIFKLRPLSNLNNLFVLCLKLLRLNL